MTQLVWSYLSKIGNLFRSFCHPENSGKWVSHIIRFYASFTYAYCKKATQQEYQLAQKAKRESKVEEEDQS